MDTFDPVQGFKKKRPLADGAVAPTPETTRPFGFAATAARGPAPLMSQPQTPAPVAPVAPQGVQGQIGGGTTPYTPEPAAPKPGLLQRAAGAVGDYWNSQQLGPGQTVPLTGQFATPGDTRTTPGMARDAEVAADYAAAPRGLSGAQAAPMPATAGMGPSFPAPAPAPQQAIVDAHTAQPAAAAATAPEAATPAPFQTPAEAAYERMTLAQAKHNNRWADEAAQRYDAQRGGDALKASIPQLSPEVAAMFPGAAFAVNSAPARIDAARERQSYNRGFKELQEENTMRRAAGTNETARYGAELHLAGTQGLIGEQGRQFDANYNVGNETRALEGRETMLKKSGLTGEALNNLDRFTMQNKDPATGKYLHEMNREAQVEALPRLLEIHALQEKFNKSGEDQIGRDSSNVAPSAGDLIVRQQKLSDVNRSGIIHDWTPFAGVPDITSTRDAKGDIEKLGLLDYFKRWGTGRDRVLENQSNGQRIPLGRAYRADSGAPTGRIDNIRVIKSLRGDRE
jgi:hypothetical protein